MSLASLKTWEDMLRLGSSDATLWMDGNGKMQTTPANLWPGSGFLTEFSEDGEPVGHDLSFDVIEIVAYHYNLSRPGARNRIEQLARQTASPRPLSESSYTHQGAWVPGGQHEATSRVRPPRPELETAPNGSKGFTPGRYGLADGWSSAFGPAGIGGFVFFDLAAGEFPKLPRRDSIPPGAVTYDIAMTARNGGPQTAVYVRRIPVELLTDDMVPVPGPWSNRHGRPPQGNGSGVPRAAKPRKRDTGHETSVFDTMAGSWTPRYEYWLPALPGSGNSPRTNLPGAPGERIRLKGSRYRVKVPGPAPENAEWVDAAYATEDSGSALGKPVNPRTEDLAPAPEAFAAFEDAKASTAASGGDGGGTSSQSARPEDSPDPREVRPSGKRSDREYLGQEIDFEESRLVSLINAEREKRGLPILVLNAALNRAAENGTDPAAEGYRGSVEAVLGGGSAEEVSAYLLENSGALEAKYEAIGVARRLGGGEWEWDAYYGDDPELPDAAAYECDSFVVEHVEEDGTVYSSEVDFEDARLGWDLTSNGQMHYTYNGSFGAVVEEAMARLDGVSALSIKPGGSQVAITDGSLDGAMARTYSDGRIVLDAGVYRSATKNAQLAATGHEGMHGAGEGHVEVASLLNTPVYINRSTNHEHPTSYDRSRLVDVYGSASSGGGGGSSEPPGGYGNEIRKPKEEEETQEPEFHYEWRTSPFKEKTALYFRLPKMVRKNREALKNLKCTVRWTHESPTGAITEYRAYDSKKGPASYFDATDAFDGRIECPGLSPDAPQANKKGRGPRVRLIQEDPPTEDTTVIEPPDPSSAPDVPEIAGIEVLPAGRYAGAVQGVLKGGGLTEVSLPGRDANMRPFVETTSTQTVRIVPQTGVNLLKNAEGTQLNGQGLPEDWTLENVAATDPGHVRPEEGVWRIGVLTSTTTQPRAISRAIPVGTETILQIAGTIGATRVTSGTVRLSLRQLNENRQLVTDAQGNALTDLVVADLASTGETPFSQRYGAQGTALDPQTAYAQVVIRLGGTTVNTEGYLKDLLVFPFPANIGKVEEGSGGEPASFSPAPETPAPAGSFALVGPAPEPPGGTSQNAQPFAFETFEDGFVPANWTLMGTAPDSGVQQGAGIFGLWGFRARDTLTTGAHGRWIQRQFPELTNTASALRAVYRVDQVPTSGTIAFHSIQGSGGSNLAYLRVGQAGGLAVTVFENGKMPQTFSLDTTVYAGTRLDAELAFVPGTNGLVTVSLGLGGKQREVVFQRNFDLKDRNGDVMRPGVVFSFDAKTRYSVAMDNVVVTRRGDVLDREKPLPPAGVSIPPEDRPVKAAAPRRFDPRGDRVNQLRAFLNVGEGLKTIPLLEDPLNVRPGLSYCVGAFARWSVFFGNTAPGIRVWLESDDKDLKPLLAASVRSMTGERGWHPAGTERDDYAAFTVPAAEGDSPGYTRARVELAITPGFYVMQEFLFAQESATFTRADMDDFAKRDAMRTYARATSGTGEWTLPVLPDMPDLGPQFGHWLSEVGVKTVEAEDEAGNPVGSLTATFATTSDGITHAPYTSPESQAMRLMRFSVSLTGDGQLGPEIPAGGVFARSWCPEGVLTREDGSPFPGGAFVGRSLWVSSYPDMEDRRVGGRLAPVPVSEVLDRLASGFKVGVTTEDAIEEIEFLSRVGRLRLEIPGMGNTVAGSGLLVRCEGGISFEGGPVPSRIASEFNVPRRVLHAVGGCEYAEVLQSGPLQPPMGPPISQRQLELSPAVIGG